MRRAALSDRLSCGWPAIGLATDCRLASRPIRPIVRRVQGWLAANAEILGIVTVQASGCWREPTAPCGTSHQLRAGWRADCFHTSLCSPAPASANLPPAYTICQRISLPRANATAAAVRFPSARCRASTAMSSALSARRRKRRIQTTSVRATRSWSRCAWATTTSRESASQPTCRGFARCGCGFPFCQSRQRRSPRHRGRRVRSAMSRRLLDRISRPADRRRNTSPLDGPSASATVLDGRLFVKTVSSIRSSIKPGPPLADRAFFDGPVRRRIGGAGLAGGWPPIGLPKDGPVGPGRRSRKRTAGMAVAGGSGMPGGGRCAKAQDALTAGAGRGEEQPGHIVLCL